MITINSNSTPQNISVSSENSKVNIQNLKQVTQQSIYTGQWPTVTVYDVTPTFSETVQKLGDPAYDFENDIDTLITF